MSDHLESLTLNVHYIRHSLSGGSGGLGLPYVALGSPDVPTRQHPTHHICVVPGTISVCALLTPDAGEQTQAFSVALFPFIPLYHIVT